ncbi:MAG: GNAT family N-acetyltransferase [Chloroflexota bacterium]
MVAHVAAQTAPQHVRPFDPRRDLDALATLIQECFGADLAATGSSMVQEMREMALWGPLLGVAQHITPILSGFVWVEEGRLIGNASLTREREVDGFILSNVAVTAAYRGRGIASALVDAAIAAARSAGARKIELQVRTGNALAGGLYARREFVHYDTLHELSVRGSPWPVVLGDPAPTGLRPARWGDGARLYDLVTASTPHAALRHHPVRRDRYRRGLWWYLGEPWALGMEGRARFELVAPAGAGLEAYGCVTTQLWRGPHELQLWVRPEARGRWERPLAEALFRRIYRAPRHAIRANVSSSHPEALEALRSLGFETLRILDQMCLELG